MCFVTLFLCINSIAQTADESSFNQILKPAIDIPNETHISGLTLKSFNRQYNNASNVVWHMSQEGSSARFTIDGISHRVFYNKRGRWISTIKNIPAERLPKYVVNRIKCHYPAYKVFFAQHVRTPIGQSFVASIEKENSWKQIKLVGSEIEVMGDYVRN